MKVGVVSLGWAGTALPQVFAELADMGAGCLEINSQQRVHSELVPSRESAPLIRSWAAAAGVEISGVSGYNDFAQTDPAALEREVDRLLEACRWSAELGAKIVRAFAGDLKPGLSLEAVWPALVEGFQRAGRQAETLGVTLAIENHGLLLNDGLALARLVREVDSPSVGLTLDTGNFCWAGHSLEQAMADVEAVMAHVINVHIKDGVWQDGEFRFVPAGQGQLPLVEWLLQLYDRGYRGAVCSEFEGSGDFRTGTALSVRYLRDTASALAADGGAAS